MRYGWAILAVLLAVACDPAEEGDGGARDAGVDDAGTVSADDGGTPNMADAWVALVDAGLPGAWTWEIASGSLDANKVAIHATDLRFRCGWDGDDSPLPLADGETIRADVTVEVNGEFRASYPIDVDDDACVAGTAPTLSFDIHSDPCSVLDMTFATTRHAAGGDDLRSVYTIERMVGCSGS